MTMHECMGALRAVAACLLALAANGLQPIAATDAARAADRPPDGGAEQRLVSIKARVMAADYGADLDALARIREEALSLAGAPGVEHLARYWAGFAAWRLAINGASHGMSGDDLKANLERAVADFEASIRTRDDFADAHAAASGALSWLGGLKLADDAAASKEHWERSTRLLARARELEPHNPRVLWVVGGSYLFSPVPDHARAIEVYHRMLDSAKAAGPSESPRPDWGAPEALMSLAYAHLNQAAPDPDAALEEAHEALKLQPGWVYVRDILLPQIEAVRESRPKIPPEAPSMPR